MHLKCIFHKRMVNKRALRWQIIVNKLLYKSFNWNYYKINNRYWCDIRGYGVERARFEVDWSICTDRFRKCRDTKIWITKEECFEMQLNSIFHKLIVNKRALQLQIEVNKIVCANFMTEINVKLIQEYWCDTRFSAAWAAPLNSDVG